jgi:3-hydroxybutyryl-CoA dehydrogenase
MSKNDSGCVLGLVGTGVMGRGIAQVAAQAGIRVLMHDSQAGAAERARGLIGDALNRLVERGRLDATARDRALGNLEPVASAQGLAPSTVVVEAIVEALEPKRALFRELEAIVSPDCILATNTSSLSVTAIAAACERPGRVAGFHFFNPVPLMKVIEVVDGALTERSAGDTLMALGRQFGHTTVRAQDTPGFIVNHAGRGLGTEGLQVLREGVADVPVIDRILREAAGFRMGPFELLDLIGLDVSHAVMESIYRQYYEEPRYRPSPIGTQRVSAGLYGRKSPNGGFYRYAEGTAIVAPAAPVPEGEPPVAVWLSTRGGGARLRACIDALAARTGTRIESGARPSDEAIALLAPLGEDATAAALAEGLDPTRVLAVDTLFALERHRTLMTTPVTQPALRDAAHRLLAADGVAVSVIRDSAGFVAQRVVAMVINIGCEIAQQRVADPQDIDRAVTLGLGYPMGPLAWGDALGASTVLTITEALHATTGDPRYRPSPWLRRRSTLGVSLLTPEN